MVSSKNRLAKGFIIAGIVLGFILPLLLAVCEYYMPSSFYITDSFILRILPSLVHYIYLISLCLYMGLFICSVVYTSLSVTAVFSLPYIFYCLIGLLYTIVMNYNNMLLEALPIVGSIAGIVLIPVLWYAVTKLISLIKMPDAAKIIISSVPVFIVSDWAYIFNIVNLLLDNASANLPNILNILYSRLIPFVICVISAIFLYVILNDIINRKERKKEIGA